MNYFEVCFQRTLFFGGFFFLLFVYWFLILVHFAETLWSVGCKIFAIYWALPCELLFVSFSRYSLCAWKEYISYNHSFGVPYMSSILKLLIVLFKCSTSLLIFYLLTTYCEICNLSSYQSISFCFIDLGAIFSYSVWIFTSPWWIIPFIIM